MTVRERVPLAELTTLKVGGIARFVIDCEREADVREALAFARRQGLPFTPSGEGSNVLASEAGYDGVVLRMRISGIEAEGGGDEVTLTAGSGVPWDGLVAEAARRGLWGIENLAGIPGTVGAAPVQNIGAYGAELADTFAGAAVLDTASGEILRLSREDCRFGYRDSRFKQEPGLIVLSVSLRLSRDGSPSLGYADLAKRREAGDDLSTPAAVGNAVRAVRSLKFPDLGAYGTAGSFFKNPVVSEDAYRALAARYAGLPGYPADGGVKIPLAFILDRVLALRGHAEGSVSLFGNQPLVLVTDTGATAHDVDAFADAVRARVLDATGISIEREVRPFA